MIVLHHLPIKADPAVNTLMWFDTKMSLQVIRTVMVYPEKQGVHHIWQKLRDVCPHVEIVKQNSRAFWPNGSRMVFISDVRLDRIRGLEFDYYWLHNICDMQKTEHDLLEYVLPQLRPTTVESPMGVIDYWG